jgi:hypothetical protein
MRTQETAQAERPGEGLGHRGGVLRGLIQDPASGLRRISLPRCEYHGEWLWAAPRTGLTPSTWAKGALRVTRRPDALASSDGHPGLEQRRDLIGARRRWRDPSQYRPSSPAPRVAK